MPRKLRADSRMIIRASSKEASTTIGEWPSARAAST
jgi:hypothetical protein